MNHSTQRHEDGTTDEYQRYLDEQQEAHDYLSACCYAHVSVKGRTTQHYECNRCHKPCAVEISE